MEGIKGFLPHVSKCLDVSLELMDSGQRWSEVIRVLGLMREFWSL